MTTWTRITDPDDAVTLLPAWFATRMMATRGAYGFLLATGDVARVSRITAIHVAATGAILIDVLLDHAGVPDGVDTAWRPKHYLGAPVTGATLATLNAAQIVMAVEFETPQLAESASLADLTPALAVAPANDPDLVAAIGRPVEPIG
jgi:hypothetical protein